MNHIRKYKQSILHPLRNTSEISQGKRFPPERREGLNNLWQQYRKWLMGDYKGFADPRAEQRLNLNVFQFITSFWEDNVVPYETEIRVDASIQPFVDMIHNNIIKASRRVVADMTTYGVGVFDNRVAMKPRALYPQSWFPIAEQFDHNIIKDNIIAYTYYHKQIHIPDAVRIVRFDEGRVKSRSARLEGQSIGGTLMSEVDSGPAVRDSLIKVTLDDTLYGISQYRDIADFVAELHRRESHISQALDRQAAPHLAVPASAMVQNPQTGKYEIDTDGMVFPISEETNMTPEYVTWDAAFDSAEYAIKRTFSNILWSAEISPTLVNMSTDGQFSVQFPSGASLRRLAIITVHRIRAYWEVMEPAMKRCIIAQIQLYNASVENPIPVPSMTEIEIDFGEPLAVADDIETAQELDTRNPEQEELSG